MNCADFEFGLPDFLEGSGTAEQRAHAASCEACSELAGSLQAIVSGAKNLQATEEPSPRVWNSLEIALRQEGLIHQPRPATPGMHLPSFARRWGMAAWLVPALGAVLLALFVLSNPRPAGEHVAQGLGAAALKASMSSDDQQMMQEVAARAPMMTTAYETNLNNVNQYIREAQAVADADPNDEEAQRSLMEAYEQKSLLNEIALDRSLQ